MTASPVTTTTPRSDWHRLLPRPMIYGSICSGIEAATVAWHPLGWRPVFFAEIDKFARAVLAERYPDVALHGDFTTMQTGDYGPIDVLVGGTPCQDFSVAGLRAGLVGDRGNLTLEFVRLAGRLRPRWLVWENVPGVLSIDDGRAFGAFPGGLGKCGYGFAYRILDAQHFGVPQRRRRVFVVGYLGDWRPAAAVLFEPESLRGDSPPGRETGQRVARTIASCPDGGSGWREDADTADNLIAFDWRAGGETACGTSLDGSPPARTSDTIAVCGTLSGNGKAAGSATQQDAEAGILVTHALRADGFDVSEDGTGRGTPLVTAFQERGRSDGRSCETQSDIAYALNAPDGGGRRQENNIATAMSVRRLTPLECERLQGFPDYYTAITYRGKPAADGPRYRSIGNSMAVPVMRWLGQRIAFVQALLAERGSVAA